MSKLAHMTIEEVHAHINGLSNLKVTKLARSLEASILGTDRCNFLVTFFLMEDLR